SDDTADDSDDDSSDDTADDSDDDSSDDTADDGTEFAAEDVLAYIQQVTVETVTQAEEIDTGYVAYQLQELMQDFAFTLEDVNGILETEYASLDELTSENITTLAFSEEFGEILGEDVELERVQSTVNYGYLRVAETEDIVNFLNTEETSVTAEDVLRGEVQFLPDGEILATFEENFLTADVGYVRYQVEQLLEAETVTIEQVNEILSPEEAIAELGDLGDTQVVELVYSQDFKALLMEAEEEIELSPVDYQAYIQDNAEALLEAFEDVDDVAELTLEQVHGFMFGEAEGTLEGYVAFDYLGETYQAAIADQEIADETVIDWLQNEFLSVDVNFLQYQIQQLTVEQQTQLLDDLGIEIDDIANLSRQQVVQIAYSQDFQALLEVEAVQTTAFDVEGYAEANAEALAEFYEEELEDLEPPTEEGETPDSVVVELSDFTGDSAGVTVTLEEVEDGIQVTVDSVEPIADLNGVFFDLEDDDLLDSLSVAGDDVTESDFGGDVKKVGNATISPLDFEAGVQIGTSGIGQDDIQSTVFVLSSDGEELTLDQFIGEEFGVRLTSVGENRNGSSKLRGTAAPVFAEVDDDGFNIGGLTRQQVIEFAFQEGWELGINPLEYVEVDYLKQQFQVQLAEHYQIEVSEVESLESALVVDYLYGGLSETIDFEYYSTKYSATLEATFGVDVQSLSQVQILEHAYTVGLEEDFNFAPVDYEAIAQEYPAVLADFFGVSVEEVASLDVSLLASFDLGIASELGIDIAQFVDLDYYREQLSEQVVQNYRIENVYQISSQQSFEFSLQANFNTAPTIDLDWALGEYADELEENLDDFDQDGNGDIDDGELYDALTGQLLEAGNESSDIYNFEEYFESEELQQEVADFYGVESFEEVSFTRRLQYMFGAGLEAGIEPYSEEFLAENPELEMETYLSANSAALVSFAQVQSVEQVTFLDVYNFQATTETDVFNA
ncbi:MAG: energy transducer TonB, partial [Limnospira sp.]